MPRNLDKSNLITSAETNEKQTNCEDEKITFLSESECESLWTESTESEISAELSSNAFCSSIARNFDDNSSTNVSIFDNCWSDETAFSKLSIASKRFKASVSAAENRRWFLLLPPFCVVDLFRPILVTYMRNTKIGMFIITASSVV